MMFSEYMGRFLYGFMTTQKSPEYVCRGKNTNKKIILNDFSIKSFMLNNVNFVNEIYDKKIFVYDLFSS